MNKESVKLAAKIYGRTAFSGVLCFFIYLSLSVIATATAGKTPEGEVKMVSAGVLLAVNIVALLFQGLLFCSMVYATMWTRGDKDNNAVRFKRMQEDKLKGLKIGLVAAIPSILSYVLLIAEKCFHFYPGYAALYRLLQMAFYPIVIWAFGSNVTLTTAQISWGSIALAGVPILILPIVAAVAYWLGYSEISLGERLVYSKKGDPQKRQ